MFLIHPPFGYMKDSTDHNLLVPNPQTAPIVQQIYQYTLHGMGIAAICKELKQTMVPRPSAFRNDNIFARMNEEKSEEIYNWSKFVVDRILRNPIYKGSLVLSHRPVTNCKTKERGYIPLTEAEALCYKGATLPSVAGHTYPSVLCVQRKAQKICFPLSTKSAVHAFSYRKRRWQ